LDGNDSLPCPVISFDSFISDLVPLGYRIVFQVSCGLSWWHSTLIRST